MKRSQKIIYGILLFLVVAKTRAVIYKQYEYLEIRYLFGHYYDNQFDFYLERIQEGMFVEPLLLFLMVAGLLIRKYAGWILTLLLPSLVLFYTIANLLGLVDFWGIVPVPFFIFYYVLLIILNINNVREIFKVESTKKALQGNMTTFCMSLGILLILTLIT